MNEHELASAHRRHLVERDGRGQVNRVASGQSDIAFTWSPGGDWLAFAFTSDMSQAVYDGVEVVRPGVVAVPVGGAAGYFGGEEALAERLPLALG